MFSREATFASQIEKMGVGKNMFRVFDQKVENAGYCPSCYSFTWKWTSFELY
jgi:hypothetical protein